MLFHSGQATPPPRKPAGTRRTRRPRRASPRRVASRRAASASTRWATSVHLRAPGREPSATPAKQNQLSRRIPIPMRREQKKRPHVAGCDAHSEQRVMLTNWMMLPLAARDDRQAAATGLLVGEDTRREHQTRSPPKHRPTPESTLPFWYRCPSVVEKSIAIIIVSITSQHNGQHTHGLPVVYAESTLFGLPRATSTRV